MTLVPINRNPNSSTLRQFSEFGMFVMGMVLAPLAWTRGSTRVAAAWWVAAVLLRTAGAIRPGLIRPFFVGLTLLTWPIGWVLSHLAMAVTYYGVFTPMAVLFRLAGRDLLQRRFDSSTVTYWEPYQPDRGLRRYLRQF